MHPELIGKCAKFCVCSCFDIPQFYIACHAHLLCVFQAGQPRTMGSFRCLCVLELTVKKTLVLATLVEDLPQG